MENNVWQNALLLPSISDPKRRIVWIKGRPKRVLCKVTETEIFVMDAFQNFIFQISELSNFQDFQVSGQNQKDLDQRWKERLEKDKKWEAKQADKKWVSSLKDEDRNNVIKEREIKAMCGRPDLTKTAKIYYLRLKYHIPIEEVTKWLSADPSTINGVYTDAPGYISYKPIDLKLQQR